MVPHPHELSSFRYGAYTAKLTPAGRIPGSKNWSKWCQDLLGNCPRIGLYAFRQGPNLLYVGETVNLEDKTLGSGRKLHSWRGTYSGQVVEVMLFGFGDPPDGLTDIARLENDGNPDEVIRRAIEAEVVFEYRASTGHLPLEQHEIHFQPRLYTNPYIRKCSSFVMSKLGLTVPSTSGTSDIRRYGHPIAGGADTLMRVPPVEMSEGKLFCNDPHRILVLGLLLESLGADAAVRIGPQGVWREAIENLLEH
jgi:hypothetical protein